MPRIAGINIPDNKKIAIALTYIYGIGPSLSKQIINETGIDISIRAKDLTTEQINQLKEVIEKKA